MKNDTFSRLWREFCDPEKTCMERLAIAHEMELLDRGPVTVTAVKFDRDKPLLEVVMEEAA